MNNRFVLDACALIAMLANETGSNIILDVMAKASQNECSLIMNKLNLLEVYYDVYRTYGKEAAQKLLTTVEEETPIQIQSKFTDEVFQEAGRLKATYRISLADSIALAETIAYGGSLLTSDHHEFDIIEKSEKIKFHWIR